MDYTIKHVCDELGLTVHTVRHYCDKGLVPNLRHDEYGNRIFNEESINWLRAVTFLRKSGLSITEVRHYFDLCSEGPATIHERQEMLIRMKEKAEADLASAQMRIECLSDKIAMYNDVIAGKCEDDCNPLNWN